MLILVLIIIAIVVIGVVVTALGLGMNLWGASRNRKDERQFQERFGMSQAQFQHDYALSHGFTEAEWAALTQVQRNRWINAQNEARKSA